MKSFEVVIRTDLETLTYPAIGAHSFDVLDAALVRFGDALRKVTVRAV